MPQHLRLKKWLPVMLLLFMTTLFLDRVHSQSGADEYHVYLPITVKPASCAIIGQTYNKMNVNGPSITPPAAVNPDLNLGVCGYSPTSADLHLAYLGLVHDPKAPQFPALFADYRVPIFSNAYHRYKYDWGSGCTTDTSSRWDTTLLGMAVSPSEIIHIPDSGYDIGGGYEVMVLYAAENRITFHIGNSDAMDGYVIHIEDVCTDPNLLALYQSLNAAGRDELPVLRGHQPFGRAMGDEIKVAVRDTGHFLDPRSRNDWWQGR